MPEREMLEMAARAAGKQCAYSDHPGGACWRQGKAVELCGCHHEPALRFKIVKSAAVPPNEAYFIQDGKLVGKIVNIGDDTALRNLNAASEAMGEEL